MKILTCLLLCCTLVGTLAAQSAYNMNLLGQWADPSLASGSVRYNDLWGHSAGERDYALLGSREFIHFIDVTNPGAPQEVARIGGGGNTTWRDIKTYQNYAYAVSESPAEGLLVFDLSGLPSSVTKTAQLADVFTAAHNIFIDQGFAFIVGAARGTGRDLIIYDLRSTPDNPAHWGSFVLPNGYAHDIFVNGTTAYASHERRGLSVYDLQGTLYPTGGDHPRAPIELGLFDNYFNPGYNHSSWVSENLMVMADETHGTPLSLVDVSDFEDMQEISYFHSNLLGVSSPYSAAGPIVHNPFIVGTLCYVSHYHDGVVVFDISNPTDVEIAAYYDTEPGNTTYADYAGCWGIYPFLGADRILASDVEHGLFVLQQNSSLPNLPLPVVWGALRARVQDGQVQLDWSTYEETQNKGFHVERQRPDGSFERIGWVNPRADKAYTFTDKQPLADRNYYRLAQEDWDGTLHYSQLVSATIPRTAAVHLSPNPARPGMTIQLFDPAVRLVFPLKLFGMDGRCWQQYPAVEAKGAPRALQLPADLPSGSYYLVDGADWRQQLIIN
jgi:choice-of-anchor B domain-containing protein